MADPTPTFFDRVKAYLAQPNVQEALPALLVAFGVGFVFGLVF